MDFHKIDNISIDDVLNDHMADESIQEQYGVKYHQFWVNQKEGTVFCLVEGPDAKTCEHVHQLAHGNLACAMTEVESGTFKLFMGDKFVVDRGLTRAESGEIDDGYRSVLVTSIRGITTAKSPGDLRRFQIPLWTREKVTDNIRANRGRTKQSESDDTFIGVFNQVEDAIKCGRKIQEALLSNTNDPKVVFKIGISADQPVTSDGEFFSKAIRLSNRLCTAANDNQILVSALASKLSNGEKTSDHIRFLDRPEEEFVFDLLTIADNKLAEEHFNVASICKDIGISRPQLYRKITSLTGRAPNDFLRDLRLEKSLALLKQRTKNISQVALEVGYSNPSYFSKCFSEKFGCMPSEVLASTNR
jgi:AraC-like DNA-binding protein